MKKMVLSIVAAFLVLCVGCSNDKDIVNTFKKKVENSKSYHVEGILEITNNENKYTYDIDAAYKKDDNFRVSLKNKTNEHEQIILKNNDGVFVLTPSLNKSFKFQSEWPYNNSQSYLLQNILNDILDDNAKKIEKTKNGYIVETKVNYTNNKKLVKQKIYFDKKANVQKVEVLNEAGIVKIKMTFNKIDMSAKYAKEYFDLEENMNVSSATDKTINEIEDIIYPMYVPENTYLENEEKVSIDGGERVILTFAGDNPFMLIEETANIDDGKIIPVYGELEVLTDVLGYITDGVASWISNGIEYYAISETMDSSELLEVVNSISAIPVGK